MPERDAGWRLSGRPETTSPASAPISTPMARTSPSINRLHQGTSAPAGRPSRLSKQSRQVRIQLSQSDCEQCLEELALLLDVDSYGTVDEFKSSGG